VWSAANGICVKRLVPFLPELVPTLERLGHLVVTNDVREQLLALSAATVDRLLRPLRQPHGLSTTKPGRLLKKQIPIRMFTEWTDVKPGFLEWNVRLTSVEQTHLLHTFRATFDEYWEDPAFEPYDPSSADQVTRLDAALAVERRGPTDLPINLTSIEVRPWGYQREILEQLSAERQVHGLYRNLVVMAAGTGKTVVAGLD
jgi:hypothetical protein